ncbi:anthranilate synthase component 1 [Pseudonocardia hierapolitana]|uniref:Anthranilate synthase component 1 n=1 Tax=Pseudonocardia hierapolitana TaxID=1128676 RepID=A0A561T5Q3_9PSEU|nr:anthranilate synthase component I [Pseudonocardia hierapolitana]TWF82440.1 anthranilate synthase component 1 [Pseudonocardia hierapolitana]
MTVSAPPGALGAVTPSREEFRALAVEHRVIPVTRRLLADDETPVGVYRKLAGDRPGTFLFESAENGRSWSRWSFVGARSRATLTAVDGELVWTGEVPVGLPTSGDPVAALRTVVEELSSERLPGLPPLTGGMVGYLGYDVVRRLERLPELAVDDLRIPELVMLLATDLAAVDHHEGAVTLIANAINWDATDERVDEAYDDAVARLDRMTADLAAPAPSTVAVFRPAEPRFTRRRTAPEHHAAVEAAKEQIRAGEAFQVVVSQRFESDCRADPLDVYRVLRATNPSPYMYLLRLESAAGERFDIVGSSPEALVTVRDGTATTHPIAGTRWRGDTEEEDVLLEKELRSDEKERAEHVMLVDLGRNDLGRVCEPGTVKVHSFFSVERYSHVMHLVSTVTGRLRDDCNAFDAVTACFPAGTLSGAPKPRAMEIIEELEPTRRGLYGGIVGYLDFAGDADTAIAIRTALIRDGVAYVQAGGGIVADSDPAAEDAECLNKARAVLSAVATAATLGPPPSGPPEARTGGARATGDGAASLAPPSPQLRRSAASTTPR